MVLNYISKERHSFHIVDPSPWPLFTSFSILNLVLSAILVFYQYVYCWFFFHLSFLILCLFLSHWFFDIVVESTYQGHHTAKVIEGLRYGMGLFLISEFMFFFGFFFAFFYYSLSPSIWTGGVWPPFGIAPVNPWGVPLLNTIVLLSSGVSLTWAHKSLIFGDRKGSCIGLLMTVFYGVFFLLLQGFEYCSVPFCINDTVYGSIFFILTGFHGFHVILGTVMLLIVTIRQFRYHFTQTRHFGLLSASWYWHFVDVVWLFLFIVVYIGPFLSKCL